MKSLFKYILRCWTVLLLLGIGVNLFAQRDVPLPPGCEPGYITPAAITVDANTSPGTLTANPTNCLAFLTYQWYYTTDDINLIPIPGATDQTYTPGPLSVTTSFYYMMFQSGATWGFYSYNACVVTVTTLTAGTLSVPFTAVNYNQSPGLITGTDATGTSGLASYQWERSYDGTTWTDITGAFDRDYDPGNLLATTWYRRKVTDATTTRYSNTLTITVYPDFIIGNIGNSLVIRFGAPVPTLQLSQVTGGNGVYNYQWYRSPDGNIWTTAGPNAASFNPGTVNNKAYFKLTVTSNGATLASNVVSITVAASLSAVPPPSVSTGVEDVGMNWVIAKTFDDQGNVVDEHKTFYDLSGRLLQEQNKVRFRKDDNTVLTHVFASQTIQDAYGNGALSTMPAPIDRGDFAYKPNFIQDANGAPFSTKNFDKYNYGNSETDKTNNPDPVGNQPGTVGWYYSSSNNWEPYTPVTSYPYLRNTFYHDGTFAAKGQTNAGDPLRMGTGHENVQYKLPALNELTHYLQVRNKFFGAEIGAQPYDLSQQAVQTISHDLNGKEAVSINDRNGNTVLLARPGNELMYPNNASVLPNTIRYFYLSQPTPVSISGPSWTLYNMSGNESAISFNSGNTLPAGYYKVTAGNFAITVQYQAGLSDVSYKFYNQLGQLVASIAPEGVKKLEGSGINNYSVKEAIPFITLYYYDQGGRLIKSTSANTGTAEIVYRLDGKLRFSQDAEQKKSSRYSYINYDSYGRPLEMGEYKPDPGSGIVFNPDMQAAVNPMRDILENITANGGLVNGTKYDVSQSLYDVPNNSHGLALYTQNAAFLGGRVSMTRKYSQVINNTPVTTNLVSSNWYSYNGDGKMEWGVQYIQGIGYKTSDFYYDNTGRIVKKIFQKDAPSEIFVHYYEYDPATQQIWKIYTNKEDNLATRQLQATYYYYLHGPLKRVELAGNLQGLDYTYTLHGELKAINNSDKTKDPGLDAPAVNGMQEDAFGMTLDRYSNDYQNPRVGGVQPITGVYDQTNLPAGDYAGNLRSVSWFSKKPALVAQNPATEYPNAYVYQYDDKYQFQKGTWYNSGNATGAYSPIAGNMEQVGDAANNIPAYDANGNINYLYRTYGNGNVRNRFTYQYNTNTDQLAAVLENGNPYINYTYDATGQLTAQVYATGGLTKYIRYDVSGKVVAVARDPGFSNLIVAIVYNEQGQRILKKSYDANGNLIQNTYYADDAVFTQPVTNNAGGAITPQEYEVKGLGGRIGVYFRPTDVYAYEMTDHQGNVRSVIARNGNSSEVRFYYDYYPYGLVAQQYNGNGYRYQYQGQYAEKDNETDWNAFELRMYDSEVGRWFSIDPAGQFSSPYVGMGNNPVNTADKNGAFIGTLIGAAIGGIIEGVSAYAEGKRGNDLLKEIGRGALRGAITGAIFDAATTGGASLAVAGALGGMYGELADQAFFGDGTLDGRKVAVAGFTGGVSAVLMNRISSYVIRSIAGKFYQASIEVPKIQSMGMGDEEPIGWVAQATEAERKAAAKVATIAKVGNVVKVEAKINLYPDVFDPRTGRFIKLPYTEGAVPKNLRVNWDNMERFNFIKEWHDRGYPTPKGGWELYDVHHIKPREYGGNNDFWNLVPVLREVHQQYFNAFWRENGHL